MSSTQTRTTRAVLLALVAAGALVVSACGSSSTTAASSSSTSSSAAAPVSSGAAVSTPSASAGFAAGSVASNAPGSSGTLSAADITAAKAVLKDPSTLTVCTSLPYQPFEAQDANGNIVGFDMDFMDGIAKDLGISKTVKDTPFQGIQSGQSMTSKVCDIAAAAMTITAERQKAILFSDPYYDASQALMVLKASAVTSLKDLSGKKLGAQSGTTGLKYANANAAANGYTVVEYQNITDEEQALVSGKIQAAIHDQPALNEYVKQQAGAAKVVANFNTGERYGFGVALGNTALVKVANAVIATMKKDGSYNASYTKWIGGTPPKG